MKNGAFSLGIWAIDDGSEGHDGLEYDIYGSYGFDLGGVGVSVGFTNYAYTYTSDSEFEINLGLSMGGFALDYASGEDKNEDAGADDYDFDFLALSYGGDVYGVTLGSYDNDADDEYKYIELSASGEISGLDVTAIVGTKFDAEAGGVDEANNDGYMVLSVSKSFDL